MLAQQNGARHSSCNGQASTESLGSMGLINRTEYIRLMQQSLLSLGYPDVASLLAQQSRIEMQPQCSTDFQQQIQRGEWDAALELLPQLTSEQQTAREVRFLVTQQKFLECLERGDTATALKCLREELAPLQVKQEQLHRLAGLLVCSGPRDGANGNGVCTDLAAPMANSSVRRKELLQKLQELLSPSMIVPDGRLEQLVEQALLSQVHSCPYHNACHVQLSLFTDYQAGMEQLPSEQFLVLEQHQDEVWHVSFAHAGDRLASGSKDHTAIIWACNPQHRRFSRQLTLRGHSKAVTSCCWSPDDTRLLTTSHDLLVKMWNTGTGAELLSLDRHSEDQPSNDVTASCAWLPDGKHFVTGSIDKNLFLWDLEGTVLYKWKRNGRINDIAVSPDGSCVITICQEGLVNFMGLNGGQEANIRESSPVMSMAVSPDGSYLLVNLQTHMVHMYELSALLNAMSTSGNGNGSGSGSSAATAAAGGGTGSGGAATGANASPGPPRRRGAAVGSLLMNAALLNSSPAAGSQMSGSQEELDNVIPAQPKAKFSMNDGKTARYVLHSCFGGGQSNFIAVGGEDCLVNIFSVATGECLLTLRGHSGTVNSVSWNPADPYMLATASDDKTISIWMASAAFSGRAP